MTKITLHDSQAPFTPRRDRSERFYENAGETVQVDLPPPPDLHAEPEKIEMPEFLRYNPLAEFLSNEQRDGETDEATLQRLRDELLDYLTIEAGGGGLTAPEEARKRLLSANIKPTGD